MEKTINIRITGRVQGVFFRANARKKALELGLAGWVRNEPDGSVSIMAQGEENDLNSLLEWCKSGPDAAKVTKVEAKLNDSRQRKQNSFEIEY